MTRLISRAEGWERAYEAYNNINFTSYTYDTIKQSLIDYIRLFFPESFNDYIESSEFMAIIESFAYVGELLAYRVDMNAHENFLSTAQRRESVLRLAKFISYTASRPVAARGLVKITSVSTTEPVVDVNGNNLSQRTIFWNDPSNASWKSQFNEIMSSVLTQPFGSVKATDRFQIQDVLFEIYETAVEHTATGVYPFNGVVGGQTVLFEMVPIAYSIKQGLIERRPRVNAPFTFVYGSDGKGDSSTMTGFFALIKQGRLQRFPKNFDGITPNQTYTIPSTNINQTDVWVNQVDPVTRETTTTQTRLDYIRSGASTGIAGEWIPVDVAHAQNVIFNTNPIRSKYEIETLKNNQVRLLFGDGEFADIPGGAFDVWARTSLDQELYIPQTTIQDQQILMKYRDSTNTLQTLTLTVSLTSSVQNSSRAESIDHIKTNAPATYYSQDRMVNGEDYNTFMLQDPSILKFRAINRTFVGDSRYVSWNDASATYEDVKIFGNDGVLYFNDTTAIAETVEVLGSINDVGDTHASALISDCLNNIFESDEIRIFLKTLGINPSGVSSSMSPGMADPERAELISALTQNTSPVQVDMYLQMLPTTPVTAIWRSVKTSDNPNTLPGWPTQYLSSPTITIRQQLPIDNQRAIYDVQLRTMTPTFRSPTTAFWNNTTTAIVDYDTLTLSRDRITILKANTNFNRERVLSNDVVMKVVGQPNVLDGPNKGLPIVNELMIVTEDEDDNGLPDNLTPFGEKGLGGVSDIIGPIVEVTIHDPIGMSDTFPIQLPITVLYDPTNPLKTNDVDVYIDGVLRSPDDPIPMWELVNDYNAPYPSNTIQILPTANTNSSIHIKVVCREYVYFNRPSMDVDWEMMSPDTNSLVEYMNDVLNPSGLYKRCLGRNGLNFLWSHVPSGMTVVNPSPTNIIDGFVLTSAYYRGLREWIMGTGPKPVPPSTLDLKIAYDHLINNKMISDTFILRSPTIKVLFGKKAPLTLQASFNVIKAPQSRLADNELKNQIVSLISEFFDILLWEMGETFYFTELAAYIHTKLPNDVTSFVLVPKSFNSSFGDMFQVISKEDELFLPDVGVDNISVVVANTPTNMRILYNG